MKCKLSEAPILAHPDFEQMFILDTDASDVVISGILSENIDGEEHMVAYASRALSKSEKLFCVARKKIITGCSAFC